MSVGIFIFGVVVSSVVATACWLIVTGIRDEQRDRRRFESTHASAIATGQEHGVATRADGRTVEAE